MVRTLLSRAFLFLSLPVLCFLRAMDVPNNSTATASQQDLFCDIAAENALPRATLTSDVTKSLPSPSNISSDSTLVATTPYNIESLAHRDDIDLLKPWKRRLYFLSSFLVVAAFLTYVLYFGLRIHFTLAAQRADRMIFPAAWLFVTVEMAVATPVLFHSLWSVFVLKSRRRQKLRLKGNNVPTVDVLVTCCGEDDDVILNTARAACHIDYPADRFRVIVLDDARSPSLFRSVAALSEKHPNLYYRTREKYPGVPHHFKAGNLNFGLKETMTTKGEMGEFAAALDADMIPEPEWLRAILPHMIVDDRCGLACPPQV